MRGGVVAQLALVAGRRQHLPVAHHHGADRHVVVLERALGLAQREPHVVLVAREEAVHRCRSSEHRAAAGSCPAARSGSSSPKRSAARTPAVITSNDRLLRRGEPVVLDQLLVPGDRPLQCLVRAAAGGSPAPAAPWRTSSASPAPSAGCPRGSRTARPRASARRRRPRSRAAAPAAGAAPRRCCAIRSITSDQRQVLAAEDVALARAAALGRQQMPGRRRPRRPRCSCMRRRSPAAGRAGSWPRSGSTSRPGASG